MSPDSLDLLWLPWPSDSEDQDEECWFIWMLVPGSFPSSMLCVLLGEGGPEVYKPHCWNSLARWLPRWMGGPGGDVKAGEKEMKLSVPLKSCQGNSGGSKSLDSWHPARQCNKPPWILVPLAAVIAVGNFRPHTFCKETTAVVQTPLAVGALAMAWRSWTLRSLVLLVPQAWGWEQLLANTSNFSDWLHLLAFLCWHFPDVSISCITFPLRHLEPFLFLIRHEMTQYNCGTLPFLGRLIFWVLEV